MNDEDTPEFWYEKLKDTPESWNCIDCGFNTGPGMSTRAELAQAFAEDRSVQNTINNRSEVYAVRKAIWAKAGNPDGCLCVACIEKRLRRKLKAKDFDRAASFNRPDIPGTPRLLERRWQTHGAWMTIG
jgi:hypothetical protein